MARAIARYKLSIWFINLRSIQSRIGPRKGELDPKFQRAAFYPSNFIPGQSFVLCPLKSQSVNSIQPEKSHKIMGCPADMFAESVYRVNSTNKLEQCGSQKAL